MIHVIEQKYVLLYKRVEMIKLSLRCLSFLIHYARCNRYRGFHSLNSESFPLAEMVAGKSFGLRTQHQNDNALILEALSGGC